MDHLVLDSFIYFNILSRLPGVDPVLALPASAVLRMNVVDYALELHQHLAPPKT